MAELVEQFTTTAGTTVSKYERENGQTFARDESSFISSQQFAAYSSHTPEVQAFERSDEPPESLDAIGGVYAETGFRNVQTATSEAERSHDAEVNRWLGFVDSTVGPNKRYDDKVEAAQAYNDFQDEIEDADSEERIEAIKQDFGIGGS